MRQRESYAITLIRVNTVLGLLFVVTLMPTKSMAYALARSPLRPYPQHAVIAKDGETSALGKNIERMRLQAGHTNAAAFARSVGIAAATLNDWEGGRYKKLRLDSLLKLAKGIPCTVDELLGGVDADYDAIIDARSESAHDDSVKKSYDVTSPDTGAGVISTPAQRHAPVVDRGNRRDPTPPRSTTEELEAFHAFISVVTPIIEHARSIAKLSDALPPIPGRPPKTRGTPSERPDRDGTVRRASGGTRRSRR